MTEISKQKVFIFKSGTERESVYSWERNAANSEKEKAVFSAI